MSYGLGDRKPSYDSDYATVNDYNKRPSNEEEYVNMNNKKPSGSEYYVDLSGQKRSPSMSGSSSGLRAGSITVVSY